MEITTIGAYRMAVLGWLISSESNRRWCQDQLEARRDEIQEAFDKGFSFASCARRILAAD